MIELLWRGLAASVAGGWKCGGGPQTCDTVAAGQGGTNGTLPTGRRAARRFGNAVATLVTSTECLFLLGQELFSKVPFSSVPPSHEMLNQGDHWLCCKCGSLKSNEEQGQEEGGQREDSDNIPRRHGHQLDS